MRQADIKEKERKYKHKMVSLIQAAVRGMAARALHQKRLPFLRKERQLRRFCVECEVKVAIRRCVQCKDRYCEDCYATIHKKGYRRGHNWEPIGGNVGLNDTEIVVTANNSGGKSMNASGTLGQSRGGTSSNTVGGGLNATSPWQEFFDAGAQAKYWFNTDTGEATWVCPF